MKLATLRRGDRDGRLVIVSRDLTHCQLVPGIAPTLQAALDDWARSGTQTRRACRRARAQSPRTPTSCRSIVAQCAAPLPRAYHWVDGSAYVNHVELVRKARGAEMPASFWTDPLVYQGGSDDLLGARDDVPFGDTAWGIDLEAEVAVITDDVPMGDERRRRRRPHQADHAGQRLVAARTHSGRARQGLRLLSVQTRHGVLARGGHAGRARRRPGATARCTCRSSAASTGRTSASPDAGTDMTFSFAQLIAHVTKTRRARRWRHHRLGHGIELRSQPRQQLPRGEAHARTTGVWRAAHAVPAVRRSRLHRDARRPRPQHFRRARQPRRQTIATSTSRGFEHAHQVRGVDAHQEAARATVDIDEWQVGDGFLAADRHARLRPKGEVPPTW